MGANYWIRAEYPDKTYSDFQVWAEDRINAQIRAEQKILAASRLPVKTNFRWCGMVVFIHPPKEKVA
jgi:hypothetical protein